jgi:hypothetical protein
MPGLLSMLRRILTCGRPEYHPPQPEHVIPGGLAARCHCDGAGRYGPAGLKVRRALIVFLALIIVTFVLEFVATQAHLTDHQRAPCIAPCRCRPQSGDA